MVDRSRSRKLTLLGELGRRARSSGARLSLPHLLPAQRPAFALEHYHQRRHASSAEPVPAHVASAAQARRQRCARVAAIPVMRIVPAELAQGERPDQVEDHVPPTSELVRCKCLKEKRKRAKQQPFVGFGKNVSCQVCSERERPPLGEFGNDPGSRARHCQQQEN
jgi:hypothetical protein